MFVVADHLDELRSWPTDRLAARRREVVDQQRQLRTEELLLTRVLDERGHIDPTIGLDGESARTLRQKMETARALESLPAVAAAAHAGRLSDEQLGSVVRLADEDSDAEWAERAANTAPADLARLARAGDAVNGGFAAPLRGALVADVVDPGQGDVARARAVPRCDGCEARSDHPTVDRTRQAAQGEAVGQLRAPRRRRPGRAL
jgi:hypothetical protein